VLTTYEPTPETTTGVPAGTLQFGDTSAGFAETLQSLIEDFVIVAALDAISFVVKSIVCVAPKGPDVVSGRAVIGGGVTVGVYVDTPFAPDVSSTEYEIGGGVPM
jgi:hypothetical protein